MFKKLLRAVLLGRRRPDLSDDQLARRYADLHRRLDRIIGCQLASPEAEPLHHRPIRDGQRLLVFVTDRDVRTNNSISERYLRPNVIFRKVTNRSRSQWGSETDLQAITHPLVSVAIPKPG